VSIKIKFRYEIHEESIIYVKTSFLWKQLKWILYQSVWVLPCIDRRRLCYGRKMLSSTVRKDLQVYLIKYSKTGPCCTWLASCSPRTSSWEQFHGPSSHFLFLFYFSSPVTNIGSRDMVFLQLFNCYLITQTRSCDAASLMCTEELNQLLMIYTRLQAQSSKDLKLVIYQIIRNSMDSKRRDKLCHLGSLVKCVSSTNV